MFSLFNFSSIFQGGSADSICPYVQTPMVKADGRACMPGRSLELSTGGGRHEAVDDVPACRRVLVVQRDADRQAERPGEQRVEVSTHDPDVDGQVRAVARPAAGWVERRAQAVAVHGRVERRALHLNTTSTPNFLFRERKHVNDTIQYTHTHTHTHTHLTALFQDYPGEPVPERQNQS